MKEEPRYILILATQTKNSEKSKIKFIYVKVKLAFRQKTLNLWQNKDVIIEKTLKSLRMQFGAEKAPKTMKNDFK